MNTSVRNFEMNVVDFGGARFAEALRVAPLGRDAEALLSEPRHVHRFTLPVRMQDGALRIFTGWRVRYADVFGPTKGGVRFHPSANEADLTALAFRLLLKCAVNALPHGGAGGGVCVDHRRLSAGEREQLARRYVDALGNDLTPERDILSPDLGTDAETMRWMADQYSRTRGTPVAAAINGKPVALGGIAGRPGATARGAWIVLREILQAQTIEARGLSCAVQGYGNAGGRVAVLLQEHGLKIVAACDSSGGFHDPQGLDAAALWEKKAGGHRFADIDVPGATRITPDAVLTVPADILVPAVTANAISVLIARELRCRIVLELANGPIAPDAEAVVSAKGILVIPDLVANAGGITMSHFEWAQNRMGLVWNEEDARTRLEARLLATAQSMIRTARSAHVPFPVAAQLMALETLSAAVV